MENSILANNFIGSTIKHKFFGIGTIVNIDGSDIEVKFLHGTHVFHGERDLKDFKFLKKNENLRIKRIKFVELFDNVNNELVIDDGYNISIITAPNGFGKTTTFKFLTFILSPTIELANEIYHTPFKEFYCELNNGITLSISKNKQIIDDSIDDLFLNDAIDLVYKMSDKNGEIDSICCCEILNERYVDKPYRRSFYPEHLVQSSFEVFVEKIKELLLKNNCYTNVNFIVSNRLQKIYFSNDFAETQDIKGEESSERKIDYLSYANKEIKYKIGILLKEYNKNLNKAKNDLPWLYLKKSNIPDCTFEVFEEKWNTYYAELQKYVELGILDPVEAVIKKAELKEAFNKKGSFLEAYLDAFNDTINPLQSIYKKMALFIEIFNKRNAITKKELKFTQSGIKVYSYGTPIALGYLSSGEKNDFIMFYRLIFDSYPGDIVLIDEPEISLHIEWQEEYIDRLIDICEMNGLQALVATHSPNIINGHFELCTKKE